MSRKDKDRVPSGCSVFGVMSRTGERFGGEVAIRGISVMHERANGLGGGFAGYGIYPDRSEYRAFHLIYETPESKVETEELLRRYFRVVWEEPIPTRRTKAIRTGPILWRYFLESLGDTPEDEFVMTTVVRINSEVDGAFVISSGRNMGIFKGVGYPEDIAEFFRLDECRGYVWTAHGRFPTNTVGWWGGAHPFGLLNWSLVHNGEISSYGINRRYLENFGYRCTMRTDTEVLVYLFDLLVRKRGLPFEIACKIMAPPFWDEIERLDEDERVFWESVRATYGGALVNGPFSVLVSDGEVLIGLNDRIKLRPLVAAVHGDRLFLASEEAAIRAVCREPDRVWSPDAGEPVIGKLSRTTETEAIFEW